MAVRLLYLITLQILSWLALLSRRRTVLITEVLTLRHELSLIASHPGGEACVCDVSAAAASVREQWVGPCR